MLCLAARRWCAYLLCFPSCSLLHESLRSFGVGELTILSAGLYHIFPSCFAIFSIDVRRRSILPTHVSRISHSYVRANRNGLARRLPLHVFENYCQRDRDLSRVCTRADRR